MIPFSYLPTTNKSGILLLIKVKHSIKLKLNHQKKNSSATQQLSQVKVSLKAKRVKSANNRYEKLTPLKVKHSNLQSTNHQTAMKKFSHRIPYTSLLLEHLTKTQTLFVWRELCPKLFKM